MVVINVLCFPESVFVFEEVCDEIKYLKKSQYQNPFSILFLHSLAELWLLVN